MEERSCQGGGACQEGGRCRGLRVPRPNLVGRPRAWHLEGVPGQMLLHAVRKASQRAHAPGAYRLGCAREEGPMGRWQRVDTAGCSLVASSKLGASGTLRAMATLLPARCLATWPRRLGGAGSGGVHKMQTVRQGRRREPRRHARPPEPGTEVAGAERVGEVRLPTAEAAILGMGPHGRRGGRKRAEVLALPEVVPGRNLALWDPGAASRVQGPPEEP
mmetsp:Transcript_22297/g.47443  ORF Transcript_22297/g.47443 Transcript_22297/m.47443 type:complete len:218 (+) Transcript_22297:312-965(+)